MTSKKCKYFVDFTLKLKSKRDPKVIRSSET